MLRLPAMALLVLLLSQCRPTPSPAPNFKPINPSPAIVVLPEEPIPNEAPDAPQRAQTTSTKVLFEGVAFDARSHRLAVIDQNRGPGSEFPDAASAGQSRRGLAAINGGFFTPEGTPLGLIVANGRPSGEWNQGSSLGSGIFYESHDGRIAICRREQLNPKRASTMRELLQSGPMLVENHTPVSGLDTVKSTSRSLLLWDGGTRWWVGRSSSCSLAQLAIAITEQAPVGWKVRHALNLDGGSSTDLWISANISGKVVTSSHWYRKPARNYLVLLPRESN